MKQHKETQKRQHVTAGAFYPPRNIDIQSDNIVEYKAESHLFWMRTMKPTKIRGIDMQVISPIPTGYTEVSEGDCRYAELVPKVVLSEVERQSRAGRPEGARPRLSENLRSFKEKAEKDVSATVSIVAVCPSSGFYFVRLSDGCMMGLPNEALTNLRKTSQKLIKPVSAVSRNGTVGTSYNIIGA